MNKLTLLTLLASACGAAIPAWAGNGLNDAGYGAVAGSMAGADIALAHDSSAFNINPAGLAGLKGQVMDLLLEPYSYLGAEHGYADGSTQKPDNGVGAALGGGYARRLDNGLVVGAGLFFQGGAGFTYENFRTPVGGEDELSALFASLKIAPGVAWQVNEQLSVGASIGILYSASRQNVFSATSTPEFSGMRVESMGGFSSNFKAGLQYQPTPDWVLALAYTSEAPIRLENGKVRLNQRGQGGDILTYGDAELSGLSFAQELGLGALYRINPDWTLVGELTWIDWSAAMRSTRLTARNPDDASAPAQLLIESPLNWRDQYVMALAAQYRWSDETELRFGISHGRNPIPNEMLTPTVPLIGETTIAAGLTHKLGPKWSLLLANYYQRPFTVHYNSPSFGPSSFRWEVTALYLALSRRW